MGRSGKMFAHQVFGVLPDVMTLAKALGGGLPIGVCVARGKFAGVLTPVPTHRLSAVHRSYAPPRWPYSKR